MILIGMNIGPPEGLATAHNSRSHVMRHDPALQ